MADNGINTNKHDGDAESRPDLNKMIQVLSTEFRKMENGTEMLTVFDSIRKDTESTRTSLIEMQSEMRTMQSRMTAIETDMQSTKADGRMYQNQTRANLINSNARADNAVPESLNAPLTPLVTDRNETIENFPESLKSLRERTVKDLQQLCGAMALRADRGKLTMQRDILKLSGVIIAPKV